ncbi:fungal-specific transcription factor domain-containing protein [Gymnopilus junonius]|uniref:Fungal-specific transcription factor domain-containing protein n=1 Tax=Gymnopilus junonius TaxID=109634 RepID=A0A9P5NYH0_GYMJU|nr:fungal-specific transcription factor domain-containing protein [Gymnopilus junonius]
MGRCCVCQAAYQAKSSGTGNPRGRGTYNPACDVCARKKTKCDGNKPVCQPCQQQGRQSECTWSKNPVRKPRTEQHFEAMHKRNENLQAHLEDFRKYANYLETLLDNCQQTYHPKSCIDFRTHRPIDTNGLGSSTDIYGLDLEFSLITGDDNDVNSDADPTKEICLPTQSLKIEGGLIHHYGNTAPFRFESVEPPTQPSRFPALAANPGATYVLLVDGVSDDNGNPGFDWSRHLPKIADLDRKSHDKALDLLFKFFTSWCLRIVPALFLRDMYRALSVPPGHHPPKTPHYSPMLHNALVSLGLAFLDDYKFRDLRVRQYFANTAKSWIEAECQKPNLSVVNALDILASFHSSQGDQTLGYMYFGMSARMAQALGLNVDCSQWVKDGLIDESDKLDRQWTNWTTFTQDVCWSLYVGREFCLSIPGMDDKEVELPYVDDELDQMPWVHLPSGLEPQPNYLTKNFAATAQLLVISRPIMEVINNLNRTRNRPVPIDELISEIDLKLNTWRNELPPELEITVKSRPTATPHKLMLHIAYWWLFILLHRPFFRKHKPIYSTAREIDHVKLCRRAAENIMELLGTWRSLYSLRYSPITLIQAVFSSGTIYLLTAMQAGSGVRIAKKELQHSLNQQKLVMQYLQEIGKSWQCATNIASILDNLMHEQLRPVLQRLAGPSMPSRSDTLQIPVFVDDDDDAGDVPSSLSRSSSKGHARRHSSITQPRRHRSSHSRAHSASEGSVAPCTPPSTTSPTIMISRVSGFEQNITPHANLSSVQSTSSPIAIQAPLKSASSFSSSFSSSPSSIPDQWALRAPSAYTGSPSPGSSPLVPDYANTSFAHRSSFQGYPQPYSFSNSEDTSSSTVGNHAFNGEGSISGQTHGFGNGNSSHHYPSRELAGFPGMLGGQTLPMAPFVPSFNLGDTVSPLEATPTSFGGTSVVDNDTNMDDGALEFWNLTFDP